MEKGGKQPQAQQQQQQHALWAHLPLLVRGGSKDSVEYILQALWRTRNTGLDSADRAVIANMLQLPSHSDLDPLLVCLRMLMLMEDYYWIYSEQDEKMVNHNLKK